MHPPAIRTLRLFAQGSAFSAKRSDARHKNITDSGQKSHGCTAHSRRTVSIARRFAPSILEMALGKRPHLFQRHPQFPHQTFAFLGIAVLQFLGLFRDIGDRKGADPA